MQTTVKRDVLIVGAGPTGLSLACQFVRYGIDFVIVEKNEGITPFSKAIGVQARTLEIYEQIDLARKAVVQGTVAGKARLLINGQVRGELDLSNIGEGLSPFPFVLMLEQSKNEQLLYEYLQNHQKQVLWKTELQHFSQDDGGIEAQVKTADGGSQVIAAKYLVGCDGPRSPVRHTLGLTFEGSTFERIFYVADVQMDWTLSHNALHICFSKDTFVIFFPLKGEKHYRIVGVFPEAFKKDEGTILYGEIEAKIKEETRLGLDIRNVEWFSTYKVHTRHANKFSAGRSFIAGDAAHIHTPAGAQGMNTGIQDAYNLAWKIALGIHHKAEERLLATYNEERLENAKRLLRTTDRLFDFGAGQERFFPFLRTEILPPLAKYIFSFDIVKKFLFPLISQIGITYRHSSLSNHRGDESFAVKAGDRMPYFLVEGESIYDKLRHPNFHIIVFSDGKSDCRGLKTELENEYADLIEVDVIPLYPQVSKIFGVDRSFSVLLRPDNHIGLISMEATSYKVKDYLKKLIG